jgi:hypothetical protein
MAPIAQPTLILSCRMNCHAHLREMSTRVRKTPTAFTKNAASVIGSGEAIYAEGGAAHGGPGRRVQLSIGEPCFGVKATAVLSHVWLHNHQRRVSAQLSGADLQGRRHELEQAARWGYIAGVDVNSSRFQLRSKA